MPNTKTFETLESMQPELNNQNATAQRIAKNKMLEGIFMPHTRQRRDNLYPPPGVAPARFVHYTSADAAIKIISQKQLWLRNASCMADYREVQHGFDILRRFFINKDNEQSFVNAVNIFAPGVADEAIKLFNHWWSVGTIPHRTFIASVSEHDSSEDFHGRLSMWRAFGGSAARVGLVFNVPAQSAGAEAMRLIFSPVAYFKDEEADQLVPNVIKQLKSNVEFLKTIDSQEIQNWIFSMLLVNVTGVKHEGFREEKEWRIVHCPELYPTKLITACTEIIGGVPQPVYKLPLDKAIDPVLEDLDFAKTFDRLIIGPSPYPVAMADAFIEALSKIGVADAATRIFVSGIPIRS